MDDKELLELAAKAAGIEQIINTTNDGVLFGENAMDCFWWNPLTDDGDALRLAVKLGITVDIIEEASGAGALHHKWCSEIDNDDPYAATRRAIVRAAAEIGKTL